MSEGIEKLDQPRSWSEYRAQMRQTVALFRWTWRMLDARTKRLLYVLVAPLVVSQLVGNLLPGALAYGIDGASGKVPRVVVVGLLSIGGFTIIARFALWYQERVRERYFGGFMGAIDRTLDRLFFEKSVGQLRRHADVLSPTKMDRGRTSLIEIQRHVYFDALPQIGSMVLAYLLTLTLGWQVFLIMTVTIAVNIVWSIFLNVMVARECGPIEEGWQAKHRYRKERWENVERVKTAARDVEEREHLDAWFVSLNHLSVTFWNWFIDQNLFRKLVAIVGFMLAVGYGFRQVYRGEWDSASLIPLFMWTRQIIDTLWMVGNAEQHINWNLPPAQSMIAALSMPPDVVMPVDGVRVRPDEPLDIKFRDVSYAYPLKNADPHTSEDPRHPPALKSLSFRVAPGEKVAFISASGAGKSTLLGLIFRFYDPTTGRITVNGHDLGSLDYHALMRAIGYVPQEPKVFNDTLRYNLTYGLTPEERARITDGELWEFMRIMQCDFGERLDKGLDTVLGKGGIELSGGQRQRVALTAMAVQGPSLLIVDEGTSSLDSTTEKYVLEGLRKLLRPEVGAIFIAHRLNTVEECDTFIVLRKSEDVLPGESQIEAIAHSFAELHRISPTFRELAKDQRLVIDHARAANVA